MALIHDGTKRENDNHILISLIYLQSTISGNILHDSCTTITLSRRAVLMRKVAHPRPAICSGWQIVIT